MKTLNIIITCAILIVMTGCLVKSIHPFYKEGETLFRKDLLGTWSGNDSSVWKIEQGTKFQGFMKPGLPENSYLVTYTDQNGTSVFSVHLFKLNNRLFLDFYPVKTESSTELMASHLVPMHTVARIDLAAGKMEMQWYDEEWLMSLFKQNKIRIAHEKVPLEGGYEKDKDFQVILTAPTEELQKFMMKYSDYPNAMKKEYTFVLSKPQQP